MKNKTTPRILFSLIAILAVNTSVKAQIVGDEAYMKGNYVEVGIDGDGGFEGAPIDSGAVPAGYHFRSNNPYFGFVSNPQMDAWLTQDGDFFTPGTPENGWGFEIGSSGGVNGSSNCAFVRQIPGGITSWSYAGGQTLCEWEGDATSGTNLHFKINYQLQDNDLFYITTVTVINNTLLSIPELYYYRNLDPDNNIMLSGDYVTTNTIVAQPFCCTYAQVSATQSVPWFSYYSFLTDVDTNWRASFGGFSNRDGSNLWNGITFTQAVGVSNVADEAIAISYKVQNLAPADSASFKFCTLFDNSIVSDALSDMGLLSTSINSSTTSDLISIYPNPFTDAATIKIGDGVKLANAELRIYDVLGKEVKRISGITNNTVLLDSKGLSHGIYVYKFFNNGAEIASGKLMMK